MEKSLRSHSTARIVLDEAKRPGGFILAAIVGGTLTVTRRFPEIALYLPFVVPFLVSLFTRTVGRIASRRRDLLVTLPAYRRDPVFIMAADGTIVASTGETEHLFQQHQIVHVNQFLEGGTGGNAHEIILSFHGDNHGSPDIPLYSPVTERWYTVQVRCHESGEDSLVWLDDATETVRLKDRQESLRTYTRQLEKKLLTHETSGDDDAQLAKLLLNEGYQAVMLARVTDHDTGRGFLYTAEGRRHGPIPIPNGADAPILRSRKEGRAVWDDVREWESHRDFERAYPVLPDVAGALGIAVRNFANYHSSDVSIIAFNKEGGLTPTDIAILESTTDTAVTAFSMMELGQRADRRFIQSIHGLCAAAEYSDELTGHHIWRVNDYSRHVAAVLGLPAEITTDIGTVAAMHDIGKVAIPHLIKLPRRLTPEERQAMEMHTVYGAQIMDRMVDSCDAPDPRLELACTIALHHHQHWNGTGYPGVFDETKGYTGLQSRDPAFYHALRPAAGDEIPEAALIVSLADKYDALRSPRQYKPAYDHDRVRQLLARDDHSGLSGAEIFGKRIYEVFEDTHEVFREMYDNSLAVEEQGRI